MRLSVSTSSDAAPLVLICAGGTGGHLFPAEALATALAPHGVRIALATDERVGAMARSFPAQKVIRIPSATPSRRSVIDTIGATFKLGWGCVHAVAVLRALRPAVVVGFGGYPTVPPVLAATLLGIPTIIHEQNGVMGRANRFVAKRVSLIATGFPEVRRIPQGAPRVAQTGNPVRPAVIEAARTLYPQTLPGGKIRLLVFGGSQGARVMSDVVPPAVATLPQEILRRLVVTQQAREEDIERVRAAYAPLPASAEVELFFKDLPQRIADSHLVIARSGASTVAELAVIGRPAVLVPLPGALDQDQAANARFLEDVGAATAIAQKEFTPERLAEELRARLQDPDGLTRAALAAKSAGIPDAAERLAALVLELAGITSRAQPAREKSNA